MLDDERLPSAAMHAMTAREKLSTHPGVRIGAGVGILGFGLVSWWIWTWSRVHGMIHDHVVEWGPLPTTAIARSTLVTNGTEPERALAARLADTLGLYPWGALPLLLGAAASLVGCVIYRRIDRRVAAVGAMLTVFATTTAIVLFSETVGTTLDILG